MTLKMQTFPTETDPSWVPVPVLDQKMPVLAGTGHPSNWQAAALVERTDYLKKQFDRIVIPELPENIAGGLSVICSNETSVIFADENGVADNYANTGCMLQVFEGAEQLQYTTTGDTPGTWKVTATGTDIKVGALTVSGKSIIVGSHSDMPNAKKQARVTYSIQGFSKGGVSFNLLKYQTFNKINSKEGNNGLSAYELAVKNGYVGTLAQWLASLQGQDGEDGEDGLNGTVGRVGNKSVSRSIAGTVWSDAEAIQAYIDWGEEEPVVPYLGDTCTLYNVAARYSEMREYTSTGWQRVVSRIPGMAIMAQSITTEQLLVSASGMAISPDPNTQDISAWTGLGMSLVNDPSAPNGTSAIRILTNQSVVLTRSFPIDRSKNYLVRTWARGEGVTKASLIVVFLDADGVRISGAVDAQNWPINATYHSYGLTNANMPTVWTPYQASFGPDESYKIPVNARFMQIGIHANLTVAGTQYISGMYVQQKTDGSLIVDGGIKARHINAEGLIIRNENGDVLLDASGSNVAPWVVNVVAGMDQNALALAIDKDSANRSLIRGLLVDNVSLKAGYSESERSIVLASTHREVWSVMYGGEFPVYTADGRIPLWDGRFVMEPNTVYTFEFEICAARVDGINSASTLALYMKMPTGASGKVFAGAGFTVTEPSEVFITNVATSLYLPELDVIPRVRVMVLSGSNGGPIELMAQSGHNHKVSNYTQFRAIRHHGYTVPSASVPRTGEVTDLLSYPAYHNFLTNTVVGKPYVAEMNVVYDKSLTYQDALLFLTASSNVVSEVQARGAYTFVCGIRSEYYTYPASGSQPGMNNMGNFLTAFDIVTGVPNEESARWSFDVTGEVLNTSWPNQIGFLRRMSGKLGAATPKDWNEYVLPWPSGREGPNIVQYPAFSTIGTSYGGDPMTGTASYIFYVQPLYMGIPVGTKKGIRVNLTAY